MLSFYHKRIKNVNKKIKNVEKHNVFFGLRRRTSEFLNTLPRTPCERQKTFNHGVSTARRERMEIEHRCEPGDAGDD